MRDGIVSDGIACHDIVARGVQLGKRVRVPEFSLRAGQCVVLCGPNGSGKSSLLRVLAGLETPEQGVVALGGRPLSQLTRLHRAARVAWLPQRPQLGEAMPCEAIIAAARYRFFEAESESLARARAVMQEHGLGHLIGRLSSRVSGGELQRVLLTTLVAQEAPFLLVDEPANHLDPSHQVATYRHLGALFRQGKGVLIVSHDVRLARLLGPPENIDVVCMKDASIVLRSTLADARLPEMLSDVYGVPFVGLGQAGALATDLERVLAGSGPAPAQGWP